MPYSNHIIQKLTLRPLASPGNWIIIWTLKRCTESIVHSNVYFPNIWDDNKSHHKYHTYYKIFMKFLVFFHISVGILSRMCISTQVPLRIGTVATSDVVSRSKEPAVRKRGTRSFQRPRFKLLSCFFLGGNAPAWLFPLPRLWSSLLQVFYISVTVLLSSLSSSSSPSSSLSSSSSSSSFSFFLVVILLQYFLFFVEVLTMCTVFCWLSFFRAPCGFHGTISRICCRTCRSYQMEELQGILVVKWVCSHE